jgi:hypothetical protein
MMPPPHKGLGRGRYRDGASDLCRVEANQSLRHDLSRRRRVDANNGYRYSLILIRAASRLIASEARGGGRCRAGLRRYRA